MYLSVFVMFVCAVGYEALRVHGPSDPLVAQLGGSVLLPCFTESSLPLEDLQVEWRKMDSGSVVSLFQQGKSRPDLQTQVFRDRTEFFPDEVSKGNFSILLKNVVKENAGVYRCQVNTTQDTGEVIMEMKEIKHFVVTGADQPVIARDGEDVILNCSVDSHVPASEIEEVTWKKTDGNEDILVLLYQNSEIFPDSSHESYQGRVDFFSSEISKGNFSLQLKDVNMEDKGEFTCEVHTSDMSARTTVVLHGVGFSALHILILVFCLIALLLAVGFGGPVFKLLRERDSTKKAMIIHISLLLSPNICMFVAFCLWSTEGKSFLYVLTVMISAQINFLSLVWVVSFLIGFIPEVIICSTVSIMRIIVLMKTSLYLDRFPQFLQKVTKNLAFPLYHSSLILGACSYLFIGQIQTIDEKLNAFLTAIAVVVVICAVVVAVYDLRMHLTMCLEGLKAILLALGINLSPNVNYDFEIQVVLVLPTLTAGIIFALSLQRHLYLEKPFSCVHITFSSILLAAYCAYEIVAYIIYSVTINSFVKGCAIPFLVGLVICAWLVIIYILRCHRRHGDCSQWRKIGYLCCTLITALLFTTYVTMSFYYAYIILQIKERAGFLALIPLLSVLPAMCLFKHPKHLPEVFHIMVYMFGAVGLSALNAIFLATELILKAGKGARTIEDLRVIVLPLETVFVFAWLTLQIYDAWMRYKDGALYLYEDTGRPGPEVEMKALHENIPNPD